jgi:signal transduction histidine kinase/ActR/RegA family two-component response regulator
LNFLRLTVEAMLGRFANPGKYSDQDIQSTYHAVFEGMVQRAPVFPVPVALVAFVLSVLLWRHVEHWTLFVWGAAVIFQALTRKFVLRWLQAKPKKTDLQRLAFIARLSVMVGSLHALPLLAFPLLSDAERAIVSIMLIGLALATSAFSMGFAPHFIGYMIPTIGGTVVCWLLFAPTNIAYLIPVGMCALILFLTYILYWRARAEFVGLTESLLNKQRQTNLTNELRSALSKAEHANRAKTRFLASASHDLRQPLHTLSMFSAALQMRQLDEKSTHIARSMNTAITDLSSELDSLLDISKLDAGIISVVSAEFSLNQILEHLVTMYKPVAHDKGLTLSFDSQANISVYTDRGLLERVLRNLVDNAIKYTQKGGVIVALSLDHSAKQAKISVKDSGVGIVATQLDLIFDEFYQIDNAERDRTKGLGLGLSIVQRLSDLLGLALEVKSIPDQGSEFIIRVPARHAITSHLPKHLDNDLIALKGKSILVLDDEAAVRQATAIMLSELGCTVWQASEFHEAYQLSVLNKPDLFLADLRLRGPLNGIQAIELLRKHDPELPALLISGDTEPSQLYAAQKAGITLLHKPVTLEVLAQAMATVLRSHEINSADRSVTAK